MSNGRQEAEINSKYTEEIFKHLEKQSEVLMESYRVMSNELHKLQVEEEMLMRKFYEITTAPESTKKNGKGGSTENVDGDGGALVCHPSNQR